MGATQDNSGNKNNNWINITSMCLIIGWSGTFRMNSEVLGSIIRMRKGEIIATWLHLRELRVWLNVKKVLTDIPT